MRRYKAIFVACQLICTVAFEVEVLAAPEKTSHAFGAALKLNARFPWDVWTSKSLGEAREGYAIVIDSNGLVVTIGYLILEAEAVTLTTNDGREVLAEILAHDHDTGFGLVRALQPSNIKPLRLGDYKPANGGRAVLAVGFGGTENAVPLRVVSRHDFTGHWEYLLGNAIFTAPAFPRFGGPALFADQGRLIGISSLIIPNAGSAYSHSPSNMFVPINALKPIMAESLDQGRSERR